MPRVEIHGMTHKTFLKTVKNKSGLSYDHLAVVAGCHRRSFSDWASEKYLMPLRVFQNLSKVSGFKPEYAVLPDYWSTSKAGSKGSKIRYKLYGNPGTQEGRSKGGKKSCQIFKDNPNLAKQLGFVVEKEIQYPVLSPMLAEFIGIVLGDGGLSKYQTKITLNRMDDADYSVYVVQLIRSLFQLQPSILYRENIIDIVISRIQLIRFLQDLKIFVGNKVKQQIAVPDWILQSEEYAKLCMRGLYDTDGCCYVDVHKYKDKIYRNIAVCFTNYSLPILDFFKHALERLGLHPTQKTKHCVFLRRESEVIRFFKEVLPANPKHQRKFDCYFKEKYGEVPKWL